MWGRQFWRQPPFRGGFAIIGGPTQGEYFWENYHLDSTDRGKELLMRTPMKRFGQTGELNGAAVLLASDAASFITGQCIIVDGGFLASGVNS